MKKVAGFTLLELMVTLVISAGLLLWTVSFTQQVSRMETAKRISRDSSLIIHAMNLFYNKHCRMNPFPAVTVERLKTEGLLPNGQYLNPWGDAFLLQIDRTIPGNPQLQVSVQFRQQRDAGFVVGFSRNAMQQGNEVIWTGYSQLSRSFDGVTRQLDREAFGTVLC